MKDNKSITKILTLHHSSLVVKQHTLDIKKLLS
jgi:hypothetical protein